MMQAWPGAKIRVRKVVVTGSLIAAVCFAAVGCAPALTTVGVSEAEIATYGAKKGMTLDEAKALWGEPKGWASDEAFASVNWLMADGKELHAVFLNGLLDSGKIIAAAASSSPTPTAFQGVTMAKYLRLSVGMTYDQAVGVIGTHGEEVSRVGSGATLTVMYSWSNRDGSNMNAMFQGGKLISKAQFGLK
jgi:hypothetical protein